MNSAAKGVKFMPQKEDLFGYLKKKMMGEEVPSVGIQEIDLYGKMSPWELFNEEDFHSQNRRKPFVYCFCRLKRLKGSTGYHTRTSGSGMWYRNSFQMGFSDCGIMKKYRFKKKVGVSLNKKVENIEWSMIEYSLSSEILKNMNPLFPDYVLCKVTRYEKKRVPEKQDKSSTPCLKLQEDSRVRNAIVQEESRMCTHGAGIEVVSDKETRIGSLGAEREFDFDLNVELKCDTENEDCVPVDKPPNHFPSD